jgi:putative glutamine amidotransferase
MYRVGAACRQMETAMSQPLVAVTTDARYFDPYVWHATPHQYVEAALSAAGVFPILVPSLGADRLDLDGLLDKVDGVLVTGARSNVHPSHYGGEATEENGPYDPERDATTLPLIRKAVERGVPLLAICRGIQEMNVALGGSLAAEIQEIEGRSDHRGPAGDLDARFAIRQPVTIRPGTCLAEIVGPGEIMVNSVHRQAVDRPAPVLQVEAVAADGTVEAVSVRDARAFAVGVQWHPEYWTKTDEASARLFRAFGDAVRTHAAAHGAARQAAE